MELDVKVATRKSRDLLAIIEQLSHDKKSMAELNITLMNTIEKQSEDIAKQNENIQKQNENIEKLCKRIEYLELVNRHQEEIIAARNKRLFGRKSEKMSYDESQYWLFNEIEAVMREKVALPEKSVTVKEHSRTKRGRKPISDKLPREEIVHDIPDSEKICPHTGNIRPRIGEDVREEVSIIPMQVFVKRHIYPKYGPCDCKECKTDKDAKPIISAEPEKRIMAGSFAARFREAWRMKHFSRTSRPASFATACRSTDRKRS